MSPSRRDVLAMAASVCLLPTSLHPRVTDRSPVALDASFVEFEGWILRIVDRDALTQARAVASHGQPG